MKVVESQQQIKMKLIMSLTINGYQFLEIRYNKQYGTLNKAIIFKHHYKEVNLKTKHYSIINLY